MVGIDVGIGVGAIFTDDYGDQTLSGADVVDVLGGSPGDVFFVAAEVVAGVGCTTTLGQHSFEALLVAAVGVGQQIGTLADGSGLEIRRIGNILSEAGDVRGWISDGSDGVDLRDTISVGARVRFAVDIAHRSVGGRNRGKPGAGGSKQTVQIIVGKRLGFALDRIIAAVEVAALVIPGQGQVLYARGQVTGRYPKVIGVGRGLSIVERIGSILLQAVHGQVGEQGDGVAPVFERVQIAIGIVGRVHDETRRIGQA